ncbi:MAG: hypothetical protein EA360_06235 [Balneolaceae bacterium]|nr:MAG: hypothetical protein EA360_06235 [Balneolaceae bacterium]
MKCSYFTPIFSLLFLLSCTGEKNESNPAPAGDDTAAFDLFFDALAQQCGNAYPGGLTLEPPGDEMLTGTELLIVHFRECSDVQLKLPFHIELEEEELWDRSRTWIFTRHEEGLEIRHDHRKPDGSEDDFTMYGGFSVGEGSALRQEFKSVERTEETGIFRGWRIEIEPGVRYTYGTIRGDEWSWRVDFDLSEPLEELPPAPWGHE